MLLKIVLRTVLKDSNKISVVSRGETFFALSLFLQLFAASSLPWWTWACETGNKTVAKLCVQRYQQQLESWVTGKSGTFQKFHSRQNIENFLTFSQSLLSLIFLSIVVHVRSLFLSLSHTPYWARDLYVHSLFLSHNAFLSKTFLCPLSLLITKHLFVLSISFSYRITVSPIPLSFSHSHAHSHSQYISSFKSNKSRNLFIVLWRLASFLSVLPSVGPTFACQCVCGFPKRRIFS